MYILRYGEYYKIGVSQSIRARMDSLCAGLPEKPELLFVIEDPNYTSLEKELHDKFNEKRVNREWFRLGEDDIAFIGSIKNAFKPKSMRRIFD